MARDFNRAAYFTAHLRNGRELALTVRDLPTYEEAREAGDMLEQNYATHGRNAMIYAIIPPYNYSVFCTPEVLELAAKMRAGEIA